MATKGRRLLACINYPRTFFVYLCWPEMLLTAMERMSSEVTADRTVTALKLPDDDMKGRIIGKEGRNIQALQRATGVDIMVDDTPGMVVLSSFDPIRRQVARYSMSCS